MEALSDSMTSSASSTATLSPGATQFYDLDFIDVSQIGNGYFHAFFQS